MDVVYMKEYSHALGREMEYKVYGHAGKPCIVFPAQNGRFYDYEDFGMVEVLKPWIESGKLMLFCVDSLDIESWSAYGAEKARIERHESWYHYIVDEFLRRVYDFDPFGGRPFLTGCSMGASHALNFYLRRPELFSGCIALSGIYHATYFFPNYQDYRIYLNSPVDYLAHMSTDHPYLDEYRNGKIIVCVGRGAWEEEGIIDTDIIRHELMRLDVPAWIDYWGDDVAHDWPWWKKQIVYFMPYMLDEK